MHLLLRTLLLFIRSRRRSPLSVWDTGTLTLRARPTDVDLAVHINNGRYFGLMDLGRFDLLMRAGVMDVMRKLKWQPVVQAEMITFRKSLNLGQRYDVVTRWIGNDDRCMYFEQRFVVGEEIYARGYVAGRLVSANGPVSIEDTLAVVEQYDRPMPEDRVVPEWLVQWRKDSALPSTRRPAVHDWDHQ